MNKLIRFAIAIVSIFCLYSGISETLRGDNPTVATVASRSLSRADTQLYGGMLGLLVFAATSSKTSIVD